MPNISLFSCCLSRKSKSPSSINASKEKTANKSILKLLKWLIVILNFLKRAKNNSEKLPSAIKRDDLSKDPSIKAKIIPTCRPRLIISSSLPNLTLLETTEFDSSSQNEMFEKLSPAIIKNENIDISLESNKENLSVDSSSSLNTYGLFNSADDMQHSSGDDSKDSYESIDFDKETIVKLPLKNNDLEDFGIAELFAESKSKTCEEAIDYFNNGGIILLSVQSEYAHCQDKKIIDFNDLLQRNDIAHKNCISLEKQQTLSPNELSKIHEITHVNLSASVYNRDSQDNLYRAQGFARQDNNSKKLSMLTVGLLLDPTEVEIDNAFPDGGSTKNRHYLPYSRMKNRVNGVTRYNVYSQNHEKPSYNHI